MRATPNPTSRGWGMESRVKFAALWAFHTPEDMQVSRTDAQTDGSASVGMVLDAHVRQQARNLRR